MTCPRTDIYIDTDYASLRNKNLSEIETYYNKYLTQYSEKYAFKNVKLESNDIEERNEAKDDSPLNRTINTLDKYMMDGILNPLITKIIDDNDHYNEREDVLKNNQDELKKLRKQKQKSSNKLKSYESKEKKNEIFFEENKGVNDYFIYKHAMILIGLIIIIMLTLYFCVAGIQKRTYNKQMETVNPLLL